MFTPPKTSRSVPMTFSLFLDFMSYTMPLQVRYDAHSSMYYVGLYNVYNAGTLIYHLN